MVGNFPGPSRLTLVLSLSTALSLEIVRRVVTCLGAAVCKPVEQRMLLLLLHDGCDITADGRNASTDSKDHPIAIEKMNAVTMAGFPDLIILSLLCSATMKTYCCGA
mmetsp:Transcript_352/g.688  ORF Transcript_352/g.688 Transcript_352/m.688 type:complete len:107 (+) Transcript_352:1344-1664(+)